MPASHPARRRMKGRRPGSRPATDTHAARTGGDIRSHGTRAHRDPSPFQSYVISPIANLLGGGRGSHAAPRRDMGPDIPAHESENAHMLSGDENGVTEEDMLTLQGFAGAKRLAQIARANGDAAVNIDANSSNDGSSASSTRRRRRPAPAAARFEAKLERKYEQNPFVVWLGMLAKAVASALGTAGLVLAAALYPVYSLTPAPVLDFIVRNLFNAGYLIYMTRLGRWLHLRSVRDAREKKYIHSRGIRPSSLSTSTILPIPFLGDNYTYLLIDHATREAAAIDPADPYAVHELATQLRVDLVAVLTTHKHHDHAGGNLRLQKLRGGRLRVYGHARDRIPGVTRGCAVKPGDVLRVGETDVGVIHVPCHTDGHVVYCVMGAEADVEGGGAEGVPSGVEGAGGGDDGDGGGGGGSLPAHRIEAVFTGDAIINGGVGAFFHGDAKDCYDNLHVRLKSVPDAALVFSGHEYMLMNLRFSHWLDETDENVATALREVATRRHHSFTTQPSSMAVERRVNPFFRVKERAFLGKIEELYVAMRRSARKKWYRRYVPDWLDRSAFIAAVEGPDRRDAEMGKLARKIGGTGPDFADISRDPDEPSAIECVKGIKTCQELIQYRHAIDQATAGEGGAEVDEDESPAAEAPEPGPVRVDA